jgi:hypothetical protein
VWRIWRIETSELFRLLHDLAGRVAHCVRCNYEDLDSRELSPQEANFQCRVGNASVKIDVSSPRVVMM